MTIISKFLNLYRPIKSCSSFTVFTLRQNVFETTVHKRFFPVWSNVVNTVRPKDSSNYSSGSGSSNYRTYRYKLNYRFPPSLIFGVGIGFGIGLTLLFDYYLQGDSYLSGYKAAQVFDRGVGSGDSEQSPPNQPPSRVYNFIADVVEKTAPAVVYIEITGSHPYMRQPMTISNGSGFIVEADGLILTNAHVVADQKKVTVKLYDGRIFQGIVEYRDMETDLATIRINAAGLPTLPLSQTIKLRPGEWVVAMGSPLSLSNTITAGVISSVHRASKELGLRHSEMEYIQTDASINFGNSGGPLVNLDGEVIGINTMRVTAGISFAIPADYVLKFLNESKRHGKGSWWKSGEDKTSKRHYLGITMLTLTPSIIHELQQRHGDFPSVESGVLVWKIMLESPAFRGGLHAGDIITHINGKSVLSSQDVYKAVESGEPLTLSVRRHKEIHTLIIQPQNVDLG